MKVSSHSLSPSVVRGIAVLCAAGFLTGAHPAQAGLNVWTSHGPGTASIGTLVLDPTAPGTLYVSTGGPSGPVSDSVFKSTDNGITWSEASAGLPDTVGVWALAIDPTTTPGTLYVGTSSGLFKSTDAARTWIAAGTGRAASSTTRPPPSPSGAVSALVVDPSTPGTLYAEFVSGLFKSTDAGDTWSSANTGLPGNESVVVLTIDPSTPGTLYAGTNDGHGDGHVFKTIDGGSTWRAASTGLSGSIHALALDPTGSGSTLYAGTGQVDCSGICHTVGGVFKSIDGGNTWSATPIDDIVFALALDPNTPRILYAGMGGGPYSSTGTGGGVMKSTDGGATWSAANTGLPDFATVTALAFDPTAPGHLYATTGAGGANQTGGGVFKSTNGGDTWSAASAGLPGDAIVSVLRIDPTTPGTLYAGTNYLNGSAGVSKSTNGGGTWSAASTGLPGNGNTAVFAFAFDPTTRGTVYAGTDGGVFKSTDGGVTWNGTGLTDSATELAIDPSRPDTIYAGTGGGVFKSIDGGSTWSAASTGLSGSIGALALDPTGSGTLYVGTSEVYCSGLCQSFGRLFKSTDGGDTWSIGGLPGGITALVIDPTTPTTLYAGTTSCGGEFCGGAVGKSTDGGATWTDTGLSGTIAALALDPTTPRTVYAAGGSGVFKSTDGANSWVAVDNTGLTNTSVTALAIDPTTPGTLYAGTFGGGVFDIEQAPPFFCIGDCAGMSTVAISDLITLVNMALGAAQAACPNGVPSGAEVTVALIIQAVNNALNGCLVSPTPTITATPTTTPKPTITPTPTRVGFCGDMHSTCTPTPTAAPTLTSTITPTPASTVTGTPPTSTPTPSVCPRCGT